MSTVVLVSCHNELYAPLAELTLYDNKKTYCEKHGYILYDSPDLGESIAGKPMAYTLPIPDTSIPCGWGKIYVMKDAMEKYPQAEWIFNIDTDAMITNMTIKIEDIVKKHAGGPDTHIIIPADINGINCGVMLVRNSPIGKAFLETVIAGMPLYRNWYMYENQLIQDLFLGTYLEESGPKNTGTFWGRVGKILPQRIMNSYDYKNHPKLKGRSNFRDILGTDGQWQKGDFVVQWPSTDLDFRIKMAKIYKGLVVVS